MSFPKTGATKTASVLIALMVMVSVVTVGVVAQPNSQNINSSGEDTEPNDTMVNATPIEHGSEINATLSSPNDTDYYAVNATAGCAIIVHAQLKNLSKGGNLQVDVVSPTGEVTSELTNDVSSGRYNIVPGAMGGDTAYTGNVMEYDGIYYIRVQKATAAQIDQPDLKPSETYRYNLTVNREFVDKYEPNENGSTATPIEPGDAVDATFAGYDSDVYAVNVTAGHTYTLASRSPGARHSYEASWVMRIYKNQSQPVDDPDNGSAYHFDPNGSTVATSTTIYGETESVVFTPSTNGTYYVHIVQDPQNANLLEPAPYELTVTETEPNDEMANAIPIEYEQDVVTTLSAGEEEWYAVYGHAGRGLIADIRYLEPVSEGSLQIDVLTASGDVVTEFSTGSVSTDPNTYTLAHVADVMESNETYYVRVSESPTAEANESAVYEYRLNAETDELDAYDPNENGTTATPVTVNETIHAVFKGYESDVYAVNVTAGETYDVNVEIESPQESLEIQLAVYDDATDAVDDSASMANGTPVAHTVGLSSEEAHAAGVPFRRMNLTFTAAENGTYYVQLVQSSVRPSLFRWTNYTITVTRNRTRSDANGEQLPESGGSDSDPMVMQIPTSSYSNSRA